MLILPQKIEKKNTEFRVIKGMKIYRNIRVITIDKKFYLWYDVVIQERKEKGKMSLPKYAKDMILSGRNFVTSLDNPKRKIADNIRIFEVTERKDVLGSDVIFVDEISDMIFRNIINTYEIDTYLCKH